MIKLKMAKEILKVCTSKQDVLKMFLKTYGCNKAIRLIKREYIRSKDEKGRTNSDYKLTFSCDECGELFVHNESDAVPVVCPKCGMKIAVKRYCNSIDYLDEAYDGYPSIYSNNGLSISPCTILYETVQYNGVEYRVLRRFHFGVKDGAINDIRMAKCIIVGNCKVRGGILLRESTDGSIVVSKSCSAREWFTHYRYHEIPCENFLARDNDDKKFTVYLDEISKAYYEANYYYTPPLVKARALLEQYSVNENFVPPEKGDALEMHDNFFVHRFFRGGQEEKRWIYSFDDKVNVVLEFADNEWVVEYENNPRSIYDDVFTRNIEIVKNSFLEQLGLLQMIEEPDDIFSGTSLEDNGVTYLTEILSKPICESLVKVGLKSLLPGIYNKRISVDYSQNHLWQKLGLSKENYSLLFKINASVEDCIRLQTLNPYDSHIDLEAFKKYASGKIPLNTYSLKGIFEDNQFNFKQLIDYMESVEENQGFKSDHASETWRDYLRMFEQYYGFKPKEKEDKYPDSLKKAHDVISMLLQRKNENASTESFISMNEKWERLKYEDENFIISMPQSSDDLNKESKVLGHCVHSYASNIRDGYCVILFLRRKDEPETPFFTMEFDCNNRLVQIRGKSNRLISDINDKHKRLRESLITSLVKWGKKNHIKTGFEKAALSAA